MNQNPSYQFNNDAGTPSYRQTSDMGYSPMTQDSGGTTGKQILHIIRRFIKLNTVQKFFHRYCTF
mgnify:FL=1